MKLLLEKILNFSNERNVALARRSIINKFAIRKVIYFDRSVNFEVGELKSKIENGRLLYERPFVVYKIFDSEQEAVECLRELRNKQCVSHEFLGVLSDDQ
jgi:hypothetical protein